MIMHVATSLTSPYRTSKVSIRANVARPLSFDWDNHELLTPVAFRWAPLWRET